MPLNLYNGGSVVPHIRYMAQTSSWVISTDGEPQTINLPRCVFDLANVETGWGLFAENAPPEWIWDPNLTTLSPKPQDGREWKRGFRVKVLLPQEFGADRVREFASTGSGVAEGIKNLYAQYEQQAPNNVGKVPVVEFRGSVAEVIGKGRTTIPTLAIVDWIDRPPALNDSAGQAAAPAAVPTRTAPQPASNPVQPPPTPAVTDQGNLAKPVF